MPEFFDKLRQARQQWLACAGLALFSALLVGGTLLLGALELVERFFGLREPMAGFTVSLVALAVLVGLLAGLAWWWRQRPTLLQMACWIDRQQENSHEAYSSAVELLETGQPPWSPLQAALLRQVERQSAASSPERLLWKRWEARPGTVGGCVLLAAALLWLASGAVVLQKALFHYQDAWSQTMTGLSIEPGMVELPQGEDLPVRVTVHRWETTATLEVAPLDAPGEVEHYPMTPLEGATSELTLFAVDEPLRYRVRTASLESPWFTATPYPPPTLERVIVEVTPPAYTALESTTYEDERPRDLQVPEQSRINLRVHTRNTATVELVSREGVVARGQQMHWEALADLTAWLRLRDDAGRTSVTPRFNWEVIPDEPPVADFLEPGQDTQVPLEGVVPLEAYAGDDYGLNRIELHFQVAGMERPPQVLWEAPQGAAPTKEQTPLANLLPQKLGAENQSVITYWLEVVDNREPEPQRVISPLYFAEVMNPEELPQAEQPGGGSQGGSQVEVNLQALRQELKRLSRETHRLRVAPQANLRARQSQLAAEHSLLIRELIEFEQLAAPTLRQLEDGLFEELLRISIALVRQAEQAVATGEPEQALPSQQEALTHLMRLEAFLKALSPPSSSGGGEGGQQSARSGEQEAPEPSAMERLRDAREALLDLAEAQESLNRSYREDGDEMTAARSAEFFQEQQELRGRFQEALQPVWNEVRTVPPLADTAQQTTSQMAAAAVAASRGEGDRAYREGLRSSTGMGQLAAGLEQLRLAMQQAGLNALTSQAGALAAEQGSLAAASAARSGQANGPQQDLREQQQRLQARWSELAEQLATQTRALQNEHPSLAEALREAAESTSARGISPAMQRAANALLYGRPGRAEASQRQAQRALQGVREALGQASAELGGTTAQAFDLLARVLEERQGMNEGQGQGEGEGQGQGEGEGEGDGEGDGQGENAGEGEARDQRLSRLGSEMRALGEALHNAGLAGVGQVLEEGRAGPGADVQPLLDRAANLLLKEFLQSRSGTFTGDQWRQFNIPERYREAVEAYFRSLAEEPAAP